MSTDSPDISNAKEEAVPEPADKQCIVCTEPILESEKNYSFFCKCKELESVNAVCSGCIPDNAGTVWNCVVCKSQAEIPSRPPSLKTLAIAFMTFLGMLAVTVLLGLLFYDNNNLYWFIAGSVCGPQFGPKNVYPKSSLIHLTVLVSLFVYANRWDENMLLLLLGVISKICCGFFSWRLEVYYYVIGTKNFKAGQKNARSLGVFAFIGMMFHNASLINVMGSGVVLFICYEMASVLAGLVIKYVPCIPNTIDIQNQILGNRG